MTTQQVTRSKPGTIQWGTLGFQGWTFPVSLTSQIVPGLRVGPEVTREGREGIVSFRVDDLSGGMLNTASIMSWARDKNRVYFNEGLYHHIPGILTLPYKLTSQATLKALDVSGYRAANLRVHAITSSLGATGQRWYDRRLARDSRPDSGLDHLGQARDSDRDALHQRDGSLPSFRAGRLHLHRQPSRHGRRLLRQVHRCRTAHLEAGRLERNKGHRGQLGNHHD